MRASILSTFDPLVYRRFGLPTAEHLLVLRVDETYWGSLYKKLKEHVEKNDARIMAGQEPFKLEVKLGVDYRHRSLSANAWLWAMHTIEADIVNGGNGGGKWYGVNDVTPEMIHEDYMDRLAPRAEIVVDSWLVPMLSETARVVAKEPLADGRVKVSLMKTSSYMNSREFAALSREVERQITSYGVSLDHYLEYKKLADQIPGFEKRAEENTPGPFVPKPWHKMTDDEKKKADPERFDTEKQMPLF